MAQIVWPSRFEDLELVGLDLSIQNKSRLPEKPIDGGQAGAGVAGGGKPPARVKRGLTIATVN
jgi:hypothetical protein